MAGAEYRLLATPVDDRVVVVGEPLDDRDEALDGLLAQLLVVLPIALLVSSRDRLPRGGCCASPGRSDAPQAAEISADTPGATAPTPASERRDLPTRARR